MGLLDILTTEGKKYIKDALPGGRLNPEVTPQGLLDTAALATMPVPVLGDAVGLGADAYRLAKNPSERTPLNFGLAALGALPLVPAGIFIGKGAKTWDALAASKATKMEQAGTDQRAIWKETGTFRGPDGHLRQEIDDSAARFKPAKLSYPFEDAPLMAKSTAGESIGHDTLFNAYPDMSSLPVYANPNMKGYLGSYTPGTGNGDDFMLLGIDRARQYVGSRDWLNSMRDPGSANYWKKEVNDSVDAGLFGTRREAARDLIGEMRQQKRDMKEIEAGVLWPNSDPNVRSTTLHELQHAIQDREGWARGGTPEFFEKTELSYPELVKRNYKLQDQYLRAKANGGVDPDTGLTAESLRRAVDDAVYRVKNWLPPEEKYRRLAGEAESRAVQARMNMDAAQRRDVFPLDSYDVPIDQLIIRK